MCLGASPFFYAKDSIFTADADILKPPSGALRIVHIGYNRIWLSSTTLLIRNVSSGNIEL